MDFLDPKKQRQHAIIMLIGYGLIAIGIAITTAILVYEAYGFGLGKDGTVIQSGLVFVSSNPAGSTIRVNNAVNQAKTNARLSLVSGNYNVKIERAGYQSWQHSIYVQGGSLQRYDYPFLFPTKPKSDPIKSYDSAPPLMTQSPDQRWLMVQQPTVSSLTFDEYDLKNPKNPPTQLTIPTTLYTSGAAQNWQYVDWASDNQHLLLLHSYDGKKEYILVNRSAPTQSVNLNKSLGTNPGKLSLLNEKFDQYYVYDASAQTLTTANLGSTTLTPILQHVLTYEASGSNSLLFVSSQSVTSGKVAVNMLQDNRTYLVREVNASTAGYVLALSQYSGTWYAALGGVSENKVYIYKDPVSQINARTGPALPVFVLKTTNPSYVAFSGSAQYIVDESGSQFSVYDIENTQGYTYDTKQPLDSPQLHASWMDDSRLDYISAGKIIVFDFDATNLQTLVAADARYQPFFSSDYRLMYSGLTSSTNKMSLVSTPLRTTADQ